MEKGVPSSPSFPVSSASSPEELERPVAIRLYDTSDEDIDDPKKVFFFGEHRNFEIMKIMENMEKGGPSFPVSSDSSPEELECPFAIRLYDTSDEDVDDPKKVLFLHGGEYVPDDTVPEFVLEAEAKADPKLKQVRKKLEEVRAQGWRDAHVSIDTSSFDDAYYYLWLTIDPHHLQEREQLKRLKTIATGLSQLTESLMRDCLEDYMLICASEDYLRPFEIVRDQLVKLHEYLLQSDSDAKTQYFSDCEVFKRKLKEMFPNICAYTPPLLDYVVRWWTSESVKDEENARIVFDMRLKYAHDNVENYRRANLSKGRAARYKLEIARRVGIIGEFPDEIANYRLPRECEWPEEKKEEKKECTEMDLCEKMQEKMQISGN